MVIPWPVCPKPESRFDQTALYAESLIRSSNLVWYRRGQVPAFKKGKVIFLVGNSHVR